MDSSCKWLSDCDALAARVPMETLMKRLSLPLLVMAAGVALSAALLSGCHNRSRVPETTMAEAPTADIESGQAELREPVRGGAQVWSANCGRCHNLRPPRERSDRQWEAIVHQMRVRAHLTGEEQRLILAFLKAAN